MQHEMARQQHEKEVKLALESGVYPSAIVRKKATACQVRDILLYYSLPVPQDILKVAIEEQTEATAQARNQLEEFKKTNVIAEPVIYTHSRKEITDTIAGLRILLKGASGKEKHNLVASISRFEAALETPGDQITISGHKLKKDGTPVHEYVNT